MDIKDILRRFEEIGDPSLVVGMARFGIKTKKAYGVKMPVLKAMAKQIGKDHARALGLWAIDSRETRILATLVDDVDRLTEGQMEEWASQFDYWEICDQAIMNLFGPSRFAHKKAIEWCGREEEFVKRAGFVLVAWMGVHDKSSRDEVFEAFLPVIERAVTDDRKNVMKGVNWALRQIGKRNLRLNKRAIAVSERISRLDSKAAHWIASDALRELKSAKIVERLEKRAKKRKSFN
jgi:3-methyladenine DNA glycosylase AlkD